MTWKQWCELGLDRGYNLVLSRLNTYFNWLIFQLFVLSLGPNFLSLNLAWQLPKRTNIGSAHKRTNNGVRLITLDAHLQRIGLSISAFPIVYNVLLGLLLSPICISFLVKLIIESCFHKKLFISSLVCKWIAHLKYI